MESTDTYPLDHAGADSAEIEARRSTMIYLAGAVVIPALGAGGGYLSAEHFQISHQKGAAVGAGLACCLGLLGVSFRALADARRMRVVNKIFGLIEDAWTSHAMGEVAKAESELKEALELARTKLGRLDRMTLTAVHSLGNLYRVRAQWSEADAYYQAAIPIYKRIMPINHPAQANLAYHLALNAEGKQDFPSALTHAERALEMWRDISGETSLDAADLLCVVGRFAMRLDNDERARECFSEALQIQAVKRGQKHETTLNTMSQLCRVFMKMRLYQESEKHLIKLIEELESSPNPNYFALAEAQLDMGLIRLEQDKLRDAEPHLVRSLQLLQHYVGPNERLLERILEGYRRLTRGSSYIGDEVSGVVNLVALFYGERERIRQVLEQFPLWVNAKDNTGWGPLQWATFIGRDDLVRWLLTKGGDCNRAAEGIMSAMHVACAWGRRESLLELLDKGGDMNARGPSGWSPVFWCAHSGRTGLLEVLIKRGADVNVRDDFGRTPLHLAASGGYLNTVASLLGAGAVVNAKDRDMQRTPLHWAAERGHLAVCECLVFNRAEVNLADGDGQTAYQLARRGRHRLLVRALDRHLKAGLGKAGKTVRRHGGRLDQAS